MLLENGIPIKEALNKFMEFIGSAVLVCHNAQFDIPFIHAACRKNGIQPPRNKCIDTLAIAKRKVRGVPDYCTSAVSVILSRRVFPAHAGVILLLYV